VTEVIKMAEIDDMGGNIINIGLLQQHNFIESPLKMSSLHGVR
jgi:hypothetical protein